MNKFLRKKFLLLSLIASLSLTGCSTNKLNNDSDTRILVEYDSSLNNENYHSRIDDLLNLDTTSHNKDLKGQKLDYTYLIDNTNLSEQEFAGKYYEIGSKETIHYASLARLVDENTITSKESLTDGKTAMSTGTFTSLQIIECPDSLKNDVIPVNCCDYEISAKKLVTLEGQTFYYIESTITFKDSITNYENQIHEDDYLKCEALYQLCDNGFVELSRNQTGLGSTDENIVNSNFNNKEKVVIPVEETPFKKMNGEYTMEYVHEAIDAYTGRDDYYSTETKDMDFSEYKKVLTNNEQ